MTVIQVQVQRKVLEAQDIVSFELARTDGAPLPDFSAGSHIDVHTPGGLVRQYSLLNNAHTPNRYRIAVLRDPHSRGGSASMHEQPLHVKQPLCNGTVAVMYCYKCIILLTSVEPVA